MTKMLELNKIYCGDCLEYMREMPDKCVDLVLTDPPYGIGFSNNPVRQEYKKNDYDETRPDSKHFKELFRVSNNQIICGGNYYNLPISRGWIFWYKHQPVDNLADGELIWTSFDRVVKCFDYPYTNVMQGNGSRTEARYHPNQKPLALMMWCLEKYSKEGMTVLDPFMGSGTTCVACKKLGRNYIGIEKEPAYIEIALKRLEKVNNHKITDFFQGAEA